MGMSRFIKASGADIKANDVIANEFVPNKYLEIENFIKEREEKQGVHVGWKLKVIKLKVR